MVSCLCFSPSLQKSKKNLHLSDKRHSTCLHKLEDQARNQNFDNNNQLDISTEQITFSSSMGGCNKSELLDFVESKKIASMLQLKKSQSLGSIFDKNRVLSEDEEAEKHLSSKCSHEESIDKSNGASCVEISQITSAELCSHDNMTNSHNNSLESFDTNVHPYNNASEYNNFPKESDDGRKGKECISDESDNVIEGNEKCWNDDFDHDVKFNSDKCESHNHTSSEESVEIGVVHELNPREFKARMIKEWINRIDIENCTVEETGECSSQSSISEPQIEAYDCTKFDAKNNLGMEIANNYISSLVSTSSSAQLVNLGLVCIPLLSKFLNLRVLSLSGNFIGRITPGSLPKGLHMLNLSKNNIVSIEGLRDLTRLRILDLSCNRIIRIGHGLSSCSSLKELYLSNNKISDVDGLHRLLKLQILDLRGNKISTAKGLSQLAANNKSLQAINLEGNPAQKNVGDEQIKKYLLTIVPNLIYFNKHSVKANATKGISDFPASRAEQKLSRRGSHSSNLHKLALTKVQSSQAIGSRSRQAYAKSSLRSSGSMRRNRSESQIVDDLAMEKRG